MLVDGTGGRRGISGYGKGGPVVGSVEEGIVEGRIPGFANQDSRSCAWVVEGRDDERGGTVSFAVVRRLNAEVGRIEIGEEDRRFMSGRGASSDDIDDSSLHVRDSARSVAAKVNFVSLGLVDSEDLSTRAVTPSFLHLFVGLSQDRVRTRVDVGRDRFRSRTLLSRV